MGQIKWYKRYPDSALNGMMELTLEERGAYNTVLDLIYTRDGNLPDDDHFIAGWCRVDLRVWKRIKRTLIEREKLYIENGNVCNRKADVEVLNALSRVVSAQDAGRSSARSKARKSKGEASKNSDLGSTTVATDASTTVSTIYRDRNREEDTNVSSPPPPPQKRVDVDFMFEGWNAMASRIDLPSVESITPARRASAKARLKDHGREAIIAAIERVPRSSFLRGENERGWKANIDWLLRPGSITKLQEGQFDDTDRRSAGQSSRDDRKDGFARALDERIAARRAQGPS